jgi:hypothetical protein
MVKMIGPTKDPKVPIEQRIQKWVYVSPNVATTTEEHYFFKDGYLVGWEKTAL